MKKKGGVLSTLGSIMWVLFAIGMLLALAIKLGVGSSEDILNKAKEKALYYAECIPARECGLVAVLDDVSPSDLIVNQNINPNGNNNTSQGNSPTTNNPNNPSNDNTEVIPSDYVLSRETKGYRGPEKREPYVTEAGLIKKQVISNMLKELESKKENDSEELTPFNEEDWNYWISNKDKECWNTREQVLSRDVKPGSALYLDKHLERSEMKDACTMGRIEIIKDMRTINTENSGEWICPYTGATITSPSDLVIDHIVPLSYAYEHGGDDWSAEEKELFANDLDNLLAVSIKGKKEKDSKGLAKYSPYTSYRCQYTKNVISILHKYNLDITEAHHKTLEKASRMCQY